MGGIVGSIMMGERYHHKKCEYLIPTSVTKIAEIEFCVQYNEWNDSIFEASVENISMRIERSQNTFIVIVQN